MDVEQCAIVEHRQLMLAAAVDSSDRASREAPQARLAEISSDIGMQDLRAYDARARRRSGELTRGIFDLGKLRHERQRIVATACTQACAIDSGAWARRV